MEVTSGDGTRCVHGGHTADPSTGRAPAPRPGVLLDVPPRTARPAHARRTPTAAPATPPGRRSRTAIGALDGGECVAFASGMAAVGAVLRLTARPGARDRPAVGRLLRHPRARPRRARPARRRGPRGADRRARGRTACWTARRCCSLETPSNPGLDVCDIRAAAAAAHAAGALLAVDNTTATPLGQRPLELGADLAVASDTKALAGHGDVLLGHVSTADPELAAAPARGPHPQRRRPRPDGGLARPPRARHARPAPGPPGRQRRGAGPRAARAPRRQPTSAGRGCPTTRRTPSPPRRCAGGTGCCGSRCPRRTPSGRFLAASRSPLGHQLRRPAQHRGPAGALGRRRRRPGCVRFSAGCEDTDDLVADVRRRARRHRASDVTDAISHSRNRASLWFPPSTEVVDARATTRPG